jgi:hypothetical protein
MAAAAAERLSADTAERLRASGGRELDGDGEYRDALAVSSTAAMASCVIGRATQCVIPLDLVAPTRQLNFTVLFSGPC